VLFEPGEAGRASGFSTLRIHSILERRYGDGEQCAMYPVALSVDVRGRHVLVRRGRPRALLLVGPQRIGRSRQI